MKMEEKGKMDSERAKRKGESKNVIRSERDREDATGESGQIRVK